MTNATRSVSAAEKMAEWHQQHADALRGLAANPGMRGLLADVAAFHKAAEAHIAGGLGFPAPEIVELRERLLREEWEEFQTALAERNIVEVADALADMMYIIVGTALSFGIPLDRVWAEVQRSNMAKADPATGKFRRRPDGKILKSDGWTPPNIPAALGLDG
jgi:predicted HAD superfamily Cof-like phosphohydrolase